MGLLSKLQHEFMRPKYYTQTELAGPLGTISLNRLDLGPQDVWRYRKMRGSWFTLEPWIVHRAFRSASGMRASDLDVARGKNAQCILEEHWDTFMIDDDWIWLSQHGINTVRIPIGYYHLSGQEPRVLPNTDFDGYGAVYASAWEYIKKAIERAGHYGIGVLIDLHAAAGAQNCDPHSGTSTGRVYLWESPANLESTSIALQFLVRNLSPIPNCVGLELLNEPSNSDKLRAWYESTLACLRRISPDFPIYLSDAWDLPYYSKFVGDRPDFVVADHHVYRSFTEDDQAKSGDQHTELIRTSTAPLLEEMLKNARGNLIIGEWSAALHANSLRSDDDGEQDRQRRAFAQAQLECFEAHTAGYFFWTYRKESGWDAGWSMRNATRAEILPSFYGKKRQLRIVRDENKKAELMDKALKTHTDYWTAKGGSYEFFRFEDGFSQGWEDAFLFITFPHGTSMSELGFRGEWLKRRNARHARDRGASNFTWQFAQPTEDLQITVELQLPTANQ
ncbi:Glucan 1,3-beta-glucosidase 3 [Tulasnella sp. 403]|nr:Glucan 1,3-beta-glucosidase 3 [Tulasnella sp. 403]